jgi:hypothetical protein
MSLLFILIVIVAALAYFGQLKPLLDALFGSGGIPAAPYIRAYRSNPDLRRLPEAPQATGAAQGFPSCKFLLTAKHQLQRDYILLVDRSGSMNTGTRWRDAESAVRVLAPHICRFDPDGITLIFFDHVVKRFDNVVNAATVTSLFKEHKPRGSTALHTALDVAFRAHFDSTRGATTILVVTDGAPDSQDKVKQVIVKAANAIEADAELSISFVQIGADKGATAFLRHLDDELVGTAKFDIVDAVTSEDVENMTFNELIARSLFD